MFVRNSGYMKKESGLLKTLYIIFVILAAIMPQRGMAQSTVYDNYLIRFISMSEGLPANFVDHIFKDSSGFVWIATSGGGLSRFDGTGFLNLTTHSIPPLKSNFITGIAEDHFRRLWITSENGLDILDLETLGTPELSADKLPSFENRHVRFITADANGNIWLKHGSEIYRISFAQDGDIADVLTYSNPQIRTQGNFIRDVDGDGTIWTSFDRKIKKMAVVGGRITERTVIDNLPIETNTYVSDCLLKNNEIWISTDRGLVRHNRANGESRLYEHSERDDKSLSQNFLTGLAVTWDDQLLISSLKGLNIYDPFNDCFERISSDSSQNPGGVALSSDFINCLSTFDQQIWIGTESAGIILISPKLISVKNFAHSEKSPSSIAPNPVNVILADPDGRVWTGSVEAGLSWTNPGSGEFHHITTGNSSLVHNSVSALECDVDGNLWVGTWGGGISILPLDKMRPERNITATDSTPISYIGALKYDRINNYMWIGSNAGIFVYEPSTGEIHPVLEDQPFGSVGACVDGKDRMWIGCQRGLYVFDLKSRSDRGEGDMFSNRVISPGSAGSDRINCVSITSDGTLWVGSNGNGAYRLDAEGDDGEMNFTRFSTEQGLANDRVKGILDDNYGHIWISTDNGLSRFNPKTLVFSNYYMNNGLASSQFYWNASAKLPDGRLCFGQTKGLTVVSPAQENEHTRTFNLEFTRLTIGEKDIHAGDKPIEKDITCSDIVRLHQRDKSIEFEFTLLDYGSASTAAYSYKLAGFDEEWITLRQNRHFVSFTNLPAGAYTLQVRATDSENNILGEDEMELYVARYFYRSWWFVLIVVLLIFAALILSVRLRTKHLSRQREELQNIVLERTREISDQKKLLEMKAEELASQNRILARQNEELAGHKILFLQEDRQSDIQKGDRFIEKLIETVRENYKDPELDVARFCEAMGMSKTLLNKKLQNALGQSIGQFIRTYRLSIAREMLVNNKESKNMNVSEIAYEAGFNDPKYFSRCFAKEFGTAPSSYSK